MTIDLACFISSHGYGHATRTLAVLEALHRLVASLRVRFFTTVPRTLFAPCSFPYVYHELKHDIGIIQSNAFTLDLAATSASLDNLVPYSRTMLEEYGRACNNCALILCDISPFGIAVGNRTGIASVLIENFTWDWIYARLTRAEPRLERHAELFVHYYSQADFHIQTVPICSPSHCSHTCQPIARPPVAPRSTTRAALGCRDRTMVLISTGGIPLDFGFTEKLTDYPDFFFVLAGQAEADNQADNIRLLGHHGWYHPDLINAADLLIAKSGYSTVAECSLTATPICCISRNDFPESVALEAFVRDQLDGSIIETDQFCSGGWLDHLAAMAGRQRAPLNVNGADQCAAFLATLLP